ncbi:MAG: exopolyphosphatase / guanosine-5-triphosphate,3-diphosphate pyrophosphatase [Thermoleophilaceae bacterium]|nr:exopolyphosphatase / guanosine-5-triphosphate,3-diphosphate pyrophosphatase [Thermoleophilaceae bacterium]
MVLLTTPVRHACVDIGSNTTRLLVAEIDDDGVWRELMTQRAYTLIGKQTGSSGRLRKRVIANTAEVVATQVRLAREMGADDITIVATAAVRAAPNRSTLVDAVLDLTDLPVRILSGSEEAQFAFIGATKRLGAPAEGTIVVIDVGGGSTELAIGTVDEGATWDATFRIGSGMLSEAYVKSDPPGVGELERVRQHVSGVFEGLELPDVDKAVAVGGTATSLRRIVGAELEHETLERGIRILAEAPAAEVAERFDLAPERVELLPAGMLVLEELSDLIGQPLSIGNGGLREGVILAGLAESQAAV